MARLARYYFGFFFVSGFCSLVYQVVWLRLAMASYGVNAPIVAIVVSLFMAGLGGGSFIAGRIGRRLEPERPALAARLYAACELLIALSALVVPFLLQWGRVVLDDTLPSLAWGSLAYYVLVGLYLAIILLPWCTCMGATTPLAMAVMRGCSRTGSERAFSHLYLANVLGATVGTLLSALILIELVGLTGTLSVAAILNLGIASGAIAVTVSIKRVSRTSRQRLTPWRAPTVTSGRTILWLLLATGLASMGMEIVWIRLFTPYLGTVVYAFATVLAIYLAATALGTAVYRAHGRRAPAHQEWRVLTLAGAYALLPLLAADPRLPVGGGALGWATVRVAGGIAPFCAALGFLTPSLIDRWSGGDPGQAGAAYAVNIGGSILGPLVAGFLLLPRLDERLSLATLALPLLGAGLLGMLRFAGAGIPISGTRRRSFHIAAVLASLLMIGGTRSYADVFASKRVLRDYEATVIATGEGGRKQLLVNGAGMTLLTPDTKMMAHLPLAFLSAAPEKVLVIAFGMGTTFRSALSWNIQTTAVDLVPSVPKLFEYFHPDAERVLGSPMAKVVIDDGRRFLRRTSEHYDVIIVDPPPPAPAVGSSLLYSPEFYRLAKARLSPDGILAQWLVGDAGAVTQSSVIQAVKYSFPYVTVFRSIDKWGYHVLASNKPLPRAVASELVSRMPPSAVADLIEWGPYQVAETQMQAVLGSEIAPETLINAAPGTPMLRDGRPVNEYFYVRDNAPWLWDFWVTCCI